jgi:signal transduction histidine kinase
MSDKQVINPDSLDREALLQVLRKSSLFQGAEEEELSRIAGFSHEERFEPGEVIVAEGEVAEKVYIVEEGEVGLEASLSARPGSERRGTIGLVVQGEAFGWSAILEGRLTMTARAISAVRAIVIDSHALNALLVTDTRLCSTVMRGIVEIVSLRLTNTITMLAHILSVASHDLKSPLAAVQSYLQVILGGFVGELNEKQREMLSRSCTRIAEFLEMIDNILDVSRFESGQMEMAELSLNDIVRDSTEILRPLADEKQLSLNLDLPDETQKAKGSATRLKQVVSNLVGNAIKFTPSGGKISVKLTEDDAYHRVEVADTGVGVSPEDLPRIFDDFYRGVAGDTEAKGSGLGLSISKKIIEAHGGRIWVESPCSETGKGSKFIFVLRKG